MPIGPWRNCLVEKQLGKLYFNRLQGFFLVEEGLEVEKLMQVGIREKYGLRLVLSYYLSVRLITRMELT